MMNRTEKISLCNRFMDRVAYLLDPYFELMDSCNQDISRYLIPSGSRSEVSYYGKPDMSLRFSDHWNWFSSLKKCNDPNYVQCRSLDMPWVRKREDPEMATQPRYGIQVCIYEKATGCYHHVYGDKFNRHTRKWTWIETDPVRLATDIMMKLGLEV